MSDELTPVRRALRAVLLRRRVHALPAVGLNEYEVSVEAKNRALGAIELACESGAIGMLSMLRLAAWVRRW